MAAGGTFTVQNKVRPGVYFRFRSKNKQDLTVGDRGIAALCEPLHWGPTAKVIEIDAGADMTVYTGYDITAPENRFLTEIFKGTNRTAAPRKVLLYRPTASGAVKATMEIAPLTATAKYVGVRGNDISVVVTALSSPEGSFEVSTVVDGEIKDQQTAKTVEELAANSWVDWSGTGALTANVGTALTGGEDGVVAASAYSAFLTAIEPYKFDVLIYDGADNTARTAMESFIKRVNTETGRYSQLVESGSTNPDTRYIVNVDTGVVLDDGTALTFGQGSTAENFQRILNGSHTIQIIVSDGKESTSASATFTKSVTSASVTLTTPLAVDGDITVAILQVTGSIPDDAVFKAEVTNNAKDAAPVWQDATKEVQKGTNIVFANSTAANGAAFNFRISVSRGASGTGGYIEAVSGAFQ